MENICEFCRTLSPVVYCNADAAHLCLSCDAKVHSANALSYRHPRTLVCESCKHEPAYVRCQDHRMFLCQNCDTIHHVSFQHQRKVVSCYVGSPSAKDLAALWGFDLENYCINRNQSVSYRSSVANSNASEMDSVNLAVCKVSEEGLSSRGMKVVKDDKRETNTSLLLQQILDLQKLQIIDSSCSVHVKERPNRLSLENDITWKMHKNLNCLMDQFDQNLDFMESPSDETIEEPFSSTFSHLENLTSNGYSLHGDSFWQCKSPAHNNEIWLQSMQDLGVCDEGKCFDDVNIPDVDLTFRNFEEIFGSEHEQTRAVVDDMDIACSFAPKKSLFGKLDKCCASTVEQCNEKNKESYASDQVHLSQTINSYSTSSFSVSRMTGESSGSEYKDDGLSPTSINQKLPHGPCDSEYSRLDGKENVVKRYKEKKVLRHEMQGQYTSDGKKRRKEQFSLVEGATHRF